jgi:FG-GAP-like repeat
MNRLGSFGRVLAIAIAALVLPVPSGALPSANRPPLPGFAHWFDTWTGYESGRFLRAAASADFNGDGYVDVAWARNDFFNNGMNVQLNLGRGTMGTARAYPARSQSNDIAAGDLDGDSDADLVVASQGDDLANAVIDLYVNSGGSFVRRTTVGGLGPTKVILSDMDGDTDLDLALSNYWSAGGTISVLFNTGAGTFGPQTQYPVGVHPNGLVALDLEGDGDRDLAVGRREGAGVKVHLFVNNGAGAFSQVPALTLNVPADDPVLASGDWDRDGDQDLAAAGGGTDQVIVLLNQGNRTFTQHPYEAGFSSFNLRAGDLDVDGDLDLVSATPGDEISSVTLLRNNGNGTFAAPVFVESGNQPQDAILADFNRDGRPDLAVANRVTDTGAIHPQRPDGSFANPALYDNDSFLPLAVVSADFDGDGDVDMAESGDEVHVMRNQGSGTFLLSQAIPSGGGLVHGITASDLNGDGRPDLLWAPDVEPHPYVYTLNNGDGSFGPIVVRNIQTCGTGDATTADVDDDGDHDVLVANNRSAPSEFCERISRTVRVALNDGDANFAPDYGVEVFPTPQMAIGADLDEDGRTDLIATSEQISVARGLGGGQFALHVDFDARGTELMSADPDEDADVDVLTSDGSTATAYVLLNDGTGDLSQITAYPGEEISGMANSFAVVAADLDLTGTLDLVVANPSGNNVAVHLGHGDGTFEALQIRFGTHGCMTDVNAADYNRDGRMDLGGPACVGSSFVTPRGVQVLINRRIPGRLGK